MNSQYYVQARELGYVHNRSVLYALKDFIERVSALFLLIILSPLMLFVALLILCDSRGGVFYVQDRHGKNARVFRLYKFRTMSHKACCETEIIQAKKDDPRVTRIGRFLRRFSIDELPQLVNIIKGDMALIGPRPLAVEHNNYYGSCIDNFWLRYAIKPGLTGMAQIMGSRGETPELSDMQARLTYDLYYVSNWSLWMDVRIAFMTVREIFFPRNAY